MSRPVPTVSPYGGTIEPMPKLGSGGATTQASPEFSTVAESLGTTDGAGAQGIPTTQEGRFIGDVPDPIRVLELVAGEPRQSVSLRGRS
jgi:hypothetical protein